MKLQTNLYKEIFQNNRNLYTLNNKYHISSVIHVQETSLNENPQKVTSTIFNHVKNLHREIGIAIEKLISDVNEIES